MLWVVVAAATVCCLGLLSWGARQLLYYPVKYPDGNWGVRQALGAEDVWLQAADGTKLNAWWIAPAGAKIATVHLHGNAGNITHRDLIAASITAAGSAVLLLEYRGYGRSEGKPSESGLQQDAEAAFDFVVARGWRPEQIVIHGESLGTGVATWLATRRKCAGLVLEAPFTSAGAVAGGILPLIGPLLIREYDSMPHIRQIHVPLLVIHGDQDDVIPYRLGRELFQAANEPKTLWTLQGAGHNDLHVVGAREFRNRLAAFYATLH